MHRHPATGLGAPVATVHVVAPGRVIHAMDQTYSQNCMCRQVPDMRAEGDLQGQACPSAVAYRADAKDLGQQRA
ncbi:hypothetical protein RJZ57_008325 [Blastomyces gilchristii]